MTKIILFNLLQPLHICLQWEFDPLANQFVFDFTNISVTPLKSQNKDIMNWFIDLEHY